MKSLYGTKVVLALEMSRVEKLEFNKDPTNEEAFMINAGTSIAQIVDQFISTNNLKKHCVLFIGKGNNGGDAYVCGSILLKKGYTVDVIQAFPLEQCSALNQKMGKEFFSHNKSKILKDHLPDKGLIIDGLLGTGFKGKVEEPLATIIDKINSSSLPVISIDIPSGVDGNTGQVATKAVIADLTIFLGMAKTGFFIASGYNHVQKLAYADFGLGKEYIEEANEDFFLLDENALKECLPKIPFTRHKYQAGYVLAFTGSSGMRGAACLSSLSALRTGSGMIRLFVPENLQMHLPLEVVCSDRDQTIFFEEAKRAKVAYLGPGIGRDEKTKKFLQTLLEKIELPCVIDADALFLIGKHDLTIPKNSILTPHRKEMATLLGQETSDLDEKVFFEKCQAYVEKHNAVLVLKGAPTFIFQSEHKPLVIPKGDPGMATAGTGDVLTGIIASFVSQGLFPFHAAVLGATVHGICGEIAAKEKTSYSVIASDLIEKIPEALAYLKV